MVVRVFGLLKKFFYSIVNYQNNNIDYFLNIKNYTIEIGILYYYNLSQKC